MKTGFLKISILSISVLTLMTGTAISPALGEISVAFPSVSPTWIRLIVTIPAVMIVICSILCASLSKFISKRTLVLCGVGLYIVAGVGSAAAPSFRLLFVSRLILGMAAGVFVPLANALILDFFDGPESGHMMGLAAMCNNLGGMIGPFCAGLLATFSWRHTFLIYLMGVPVFFLCLRGLREPPREEIDRSGKGRLPAEVLVLGGLTVLYMIAFTTVPVNLSLFVTGEKLGSTGSVGAILAVFSLFGMLEGAFLPQLMRLLKSALIPLALALMSVGFALLYISRDMGMILVSVIVFGAGSGSIIPYLFLTASRKAPRESSTLAMSVISGCVYLGQFLMPFVFDLVGVASGKSSIRFGFFVFSCCLALGALVAIYRAIMSKRGSAELALPELVSLESECVPSLQSDNDLN
jgi:predicted MFS family arabinose efflux permease